MTRSLFRDGRLVGVLEELPDGDVGTVVRANHDEALATLRGGSLECFSTELESVFVDLAERSETLEAFLFAVQVEGVEIREGRIAPTFRDRRF